AEQPAQQQAPAEPQPSQVEMVRRAWPEVLEFLKSQSRLIWMTINGNAQVVGFDGHLLTIGFDNDGARNTVQMRGGKRLLAAGFKHMLGIQPVLDLFINAFFGVPPKAPSSLAPLQPEHISHATPHSDPPFQPAPPQQPAPSQQPAQQQAPATRQE